VAAAADGTGCMRVRVIPSMFFKVTYFTRVMVVLLCCATAAGCAGTSSGKKSSPPATATSRQAAVAARVCQSADQAARPLLGDRTQVRIADADPANIECLIDAGGIRVDTVAQASAQAWTEFDTATVHQVQAFGSGAVYVPSQLPHPVPGMSGNVAWIPAQQEVLATNGTQTRGGTYVTATVTRHSPKGPSSLAVARAVTRAVLTSAPRGPNPAPPA
jgi:hypothetical protein